MAVFTNFTLSNLSVECSMLVIFYRKHFNLVIFRSKIFDQKNQTTLIDLCHRIDIKIYSVMVEFINQFKAKSMINNLCKKISMESQIN